MTEKKKMHIATKIVLWAVGLFLAQPLLIVLFWLLPGLFYSAGSSQAGLGPAAPEDKSVGQFLASISARGEYLDTFGGKAEFRGIAELADCSSKGDRCLRSQSDVMPKDETATRCKGFIAWAEELGATQVTGPDDSKWIPLTEVDVQQKCIDTLQGRVRWMPDGLTSEQILLNGDSQQLGGSFTVALTRTEELPDPPAGQGPISWPGGKTAVPTYAPQFSYTAEIDTEKYGTNVTMKAQSTGWKHQSAALLDVVAYLRHNYPSYQPADPVFTKFMLDFFDKRFHYGTTLTPVASADKQVRWIDLKTVGHGRVCLSVSEQMDTGNGIEQVGAARAGLGGGVTAFQGLGQEVSAQTADTGWGNYVMGGCDGMPQSPAHPERLVVINPAVDVTGFKPVAPKNAAETKVLICQGAQIVKDRIKFLTSPPLASLTDLTVNQGIQLSDWNDPRIDLLGHQIEKYTHKKSLPDVDKLREQYGYMQSAAGYIRQAGGQYAGRKHDQQFRFTNKTKNLGEYYDRAFNVAAGPDDIGSFRFSYKPLLDYCGLR